MADRSAAKRRSTATPVAGSGEAGGPARPPWRAWIAPLLLCAVALVQIALATGGNLLAWKGGGFGMFAVIDRHGLRALRASDADGAPIAIPDGLLLVEQRARAWPTAGRLRALAVAIERETGQRVAHIEAERTVFDRAWDARWETLGRIVLDAPAGARSSEP